MDNTLLQRCYDALKAVEAKLKSTIEKKEKAVNCFSPNFNVLLVCGV